MVATNKLVIKFLEGIVISNKNGELFLLKRELYPEILVSI